MSSQSGIVNCPLCGDVTRLLAKVIYAAPERDPSEGGVTMVMPEEIIRESILFCDVLPHHYVEAYYCARHRIHLEPLRGPEPNPAADREET